MNCQNGECLKNGKIWPLAQSCPLCAICQTEETGLRLLKSVSGALFTSATRWLRSQQFDGRGFTKRGVVSKIWRSLHAIIIYSTPFLQGSRSAPVLLVVVGSTLDWDRFRHASFAVRHPSDKRRLEMPPSKKCVIKC